MVGSFDLGDRLDYRSLDIEERLVEIEQILMQFQSPLSQYRFRINVSDWPLIDQSTRVAWLSLCKLVDPRLSHKSVEPMADRNCASALAICASTFSFGRIEFRYGGVRSPKLTLQTLDIGSSSQLVAELQQSPNGPTILAIKCPCTCKLPIRDRDFVDMFLNTFDRYLRTGVCRKLCDNDRRTIVGDAASFVKG